MITKRVVVAVCPSMEDDYLRRQGKREYWEELSEIVFDEPVKDNEEGDKQSATPLCR